MNKEQFFRDIDGTVIEEIFMVQSDSYIEPDAAVKPTEEILGKMSTLEKCIFTVLSEKTKILSDLFKRAARHLDEETLSLTGDEFSRLATLFKEYGLLKSMLAAIMASRLKTESFTNLKVRGGFVIVAATEDNSPEDDRCSSCPAKVLCDKVKGGQINFCAN